ncbi:unnamed protein product [Allacma fusca]|uniref:Uncharacterized protein n=1 Tax=Allacma fusca TaxID=39272 RepID=A0A8J2LI27_9HEXA|nr:unnamed protein product [Allacma fusca]
MAISYHAVKAITFLKLILNIIIIILYKHGDEGYFLGASFNKRKRPGFCFGNTLERCGLYPLVDSCGGGDSFLAPLYSCKPLLEQEPQSQGNCYGILDDCKFLLVPGRRDPGLCKL